MDSKQNLSQAVEQVVSPAAGATPAMGQTVRPVANAPENQNNNVVFQDKPKKNTAMILGMVILLILAIGGIGFGVWTMMDGNQQREQLNTQIEALKKQKSDLDSQIIELQAEIEQYKAASSDVTEILPPNQSEAEAVVIENKFTIKNANGDIYMQLDEHLVEEIVSCEPGTAEASAQLTCIVKTADGEAKVIYDYNEHSLEFVKTTE